MYLMYTVDIPNAIANDRVLRIYALIGKDLVRRLFVGLVSSL